MKAGSRAVFLVCALAALLALPAAAASAQAKYDVSPGSFVLEVSLPKSKGWNMSLTAVGRRQIHLTVAKGAMTVIYRVPGRASRRHLEADFGPLGRIDIRMNLQPLSSARPSARKAKRFRRCRGKPQLILAGRYHGIIDFKGEENVARAFARTGNAFVERTFRTVCKRPTGKQPKGNGKGAPKIDVGVGMLAARAHGGGRTTTVEALGIEIESEVIFGAFIGSVHERLGRVRIIRAALEFVEGPELKFSPKGRRPSTATLKPPEPFAGGASYLKQAGSPATWTGDLRVRLPGAGEVPLAGPEFNATLCRSDRIEALGSLLKCVASIQTLAGLGGGPVEQLRELYGSGSHSQPLALTKLSSLR
jgi:hypothetical protein